MILKKIRVRIGYSQKLSGLVGYRVPVSHWWRWRGGATTSFHLTLALSWLAVISCSGCPAYLCYRAHAMKGNIFPILCFSPYPSSHLTGSPQKAKVMNARSSPQISSGWRALPKKALKMFFFVFLSLCLFVFLSFYLFVQASRRSNVWRVSILKSYSLCPNFKSGSESPHHQEWAKSCQCS